MHHMLPLGQQQGEAEPKTHLKNDLSWPNNHELSFLQAQKAVIELIMQNQTLEQFETVMMLVRLIFLRGLFHKDTH